MGIHDKIDYLDSYINRHCNFIEIQCCMKSGDIHSMYMLFDDPFNIILNQLRKAKDKIIIALTKKISDNDRVDHLELYVRQPFSDDIKKCTKIYENIIVNDIENLFSGTLKTLLSKITISPYSAKERKTAQTILDDYVKFKDDIFAKLSVEELATVIAEFCKTCKMDVSDPFFQNDLDCFKDILETNVAEFIKEKRAKKC